MVLSFRFSKKALLKRESVTSIAALLFTLLYHRILCNSKILPSFLMVSSSLPIPSYLLLSKPNIEYSSKNPVGTWLISIRSTLSRHRSLVILPESITFKVFCAKELNTQNSAIRKSKFFFMVKGFRGYKLLTAFAGIKSEIKTAIFHCNYFSASILFNKIECKFA